MDKACYGVPANAFELASKAMKLRIVVNLMYTEVADLIIKVAHNVGICESIVMAIVVDKGMSVGLAKPLVGDRLKIAKSDVEGKVIAISLVSALGIAVAVHDGHIDGPANLLDIMADGTE